MPVTPEPPQPFPLTLDAVMDHTDTKVCFHCEIWGGGGGGFHKES